MKVAVEIRRSLQKVGFELRLDGSQENLKGGGEEAEHARPRG